MSYPWSPGDILTAVDLNALGDVLPVHGCVLTDVAQSFANASTTTVTWGSEALDTHGYHTGTSDTITFPDTGFYVITARLVRASGNWTTGYLRLVFASGGHHSFAGTSNGELTGTVLVYTSASNTFTVTGYHASGGAVNVDSTLYVAKLPAL